LRINYRAVLDLIAAGHTKPKPQEIPVSKIAKGLGKLERLESRWEPIHETQ